MDPISQYQQWKQQGESLRAQAKQAMETRFRELLAEAAQIAQEYHRDFGSALKPPPTITAFRYKVGTAKSKKAAKGAPVQRKEAPVVSPATPPNPKIAGLQRQRAQIQKKN